MNRRLITTRVQPHGEVTTTVSHTADTVTETVAGLAVVYGEVFTRWGVPLVYAADSLTLPADLGAVKLTAEHDPERPIGYATAAENRDDGLALTFELPDLPHTGQLRAELASRLRDGLSIITQLDEDTYAAVEARMWGEDGSTDPITIRGELREATIATVPQFSGARIEHSTDQEETTMTRRLVTTTAEPAPATGHDEAATAAASTGTGAPVPVGAPPRAASIAPVRTRAVSAAHDLASRILTARMDSGFEGIRQLVNTALVDITPAGNGAGQEDAALIHDALGELWADTFTPKYTGIVTAKPLTALKYTGWTWSTKPGVDEYAGNKAVIPSKPGKLEEKTEKALRIAGGNDLDRIYKDLGDPEMITSYWALMANDLARQLDNLRIETVVASGGTATAAASAVAAIMAGLTAVEGADYVVMAADLFDAYAAQPETELPAAFGSGRFSLAIPDTFIRSDDIPAGGVIVGRQNAIDFRTFEPPIKLEAVNIAQAGIDTGLYSYWMPFTRDEDGVANFTVTAGGTAAAAASRKS